LPTSPPAGNSQSNRGNLRGRVDALERFLRLQYARGVRRPSRRLHDADVVALSERKTDEAMSRAFRLFLKGAGLTSYRLPTPYGLMHCYDSAPESREPPVVLLHGIGSSGQCFAWLALMLKDGRRVVCPDLFHFCGFSDANNPVMSLREHVASVKAFIDALGVGSVDFCGLSLGGWIGLRLAIDHPETITSLALLNPAGVRLRPYALRDTLAHLTWKKFQVLYPGLMRAFPYTGAPLVSAVLRRSLFRLLRDDAVRDFIKIVGGDDFVDDELSRVAVRTLLLWGHEDRLLSDEAPRLLASRIPHVEAWYVERCAHVLCLEAPLNVYDSLSRFLGLGGKPDNAMTALLRKTSVLFPQHPIPKDKPQ
jgi:pimeloyl-ACP methyl ester carboxylesterase